ncbi:MAG: fibronectin type III domain-containing protein, partial [Candidatus Berkelbacteria bacterium Gr01-1014_85]
ELVEPFTLELDTTPIANGPHQLSAKATDTSGNWQTSAPIDFTVNNDLIAPTVSIATPANGQTVSGAVVIEAQATDNVGVTRVEFFVDGTPLATDNNAPFSASWDTTNLVQGQSYTLTAKAFDAKGNQGESTPVSVTIADTTGPQVSLTAPLAGSTVNGQVTITATATDNLGLNRVEFYVDNTLIATDTSNAYSAVWDTTGLAHNTAHLLKAKAFDNAGNETTSAEISVTVTDITLPTVAITNPVNNAIVTRGSLVTIRANSSDASGITKVEFRVNNSLLCTDTVASGESYDCNWRVPTKRNTLYTIQARSYDTAGNISNQSIQVRSN